MPEAPAGRLNAVDAVSPRDVWAVGDNLTNRLVAEHYNGSKWTLSFPVEEYGTTINAVAASSADSVWAVGSAYEEQYGGAFYGSIIEHFDGKRWSLVEGINYLSSTGLNAVAAISSHNVWAVGDGIQHYDGKHWTYAAQPSLPQGGYGEFMSVAASSPSDVWTVGYDATDNVYPPAQASANTLIEHYNGKHWTVVRTPRPATGHGELMGVTVIAPNNVWAVGDAGENPETTLVEHYDGRKWSIVPSPNDATGFGYLTEVAAASATNVWALGDPIEHFDGTSWSVASGLPKAVTSGTVAGISAGPGQVWMAGVRRNSGHSLMTLFQDGHWSVLKTPNASAPAGTVQSLSFASPRDGWAALGPDRPYSDIRVEHFDGHTWSVTGAPGVGSLYSIAAISRRDVWAVGTRGKGGPLIDHFYGYGWSNAVQPVRGDYDTYLHAVAAAGPRDVWAVGHSDVRGRPLIEHYNGARWRRVNPSPNPATAGEYLELEGLVVISPENVWAVGSQYTDQSSRVRTLTYHFDGARWSVVPSPNSAKHSGWLEAASAVSPTDVWAVGYPSWRSYYGLIEHYDGRRWSVVRSPKLQGGATLNGVVALSPNNVWAVGGIEPQSYGSGSSSVVEHYDGTRWSRVTSPNVPPTELGAGGADLLSIVAVPSHGLWAAGGDNQFDSVFERYGRACRT